MVTKEYYDDLQKEMASRCVVSFLRIFLSDPVGIQTQDLQNWKQTLKSPQTPLSIGLPMICLFHFAANAVTVRMIMILSSF